MANKRIELEHYRHYVDLIEEEPNRKRWREGIMIAMITAMVLLLAFFVLGLMSNSLASNSGNVLEKPPAETQTTPSDQGVPSGVPTNTDIPGGEQQIPEGIPVTPNQSKASPGALLAQVVEPQPADQPTQTQPAGTTPADQAAGSEKVSGPDQQTKGVGNLANLTNGAGGRGFQLYLLVLFIGLCIVLYLPIRKARLEGKTK